jgi:tRNA(adenine34) deaminase
MIEPFNEEFMREALAEAEAARAGGEVPVGAILV